MRTTKGLCLLFLLFLVFPASSLTTGRAADLQSGWRDREIKIDGNQDDWQGQLTFPSELAIGVGVMNDENSFYLCLASTDRSILRRAMRMGLTVWFEPENGKKKFGIRFPVGMRPGGMQGVRERGAPPDSAALAAMAFESIREVEIVGPGKKDTLRAANFEEWGIEVKIGQSPDRFVYELKVPLDKTDEGLHTVVFKEGKPVSIRFETGKTVHTEMQQAMGSGRPDGMGGSRMGRGGGMGGRGRMGGRRAGGEGMREMMEPFEWSAKIILASSSSAKQ